MASALLCRECGCKIKDLVRVTFARSILKKGSASICISCYERLCARENAPLAVRSFVKWYTENKVAIDPRIQVKQLKERVAELERLLKAALEANQ
jgi:hypothetical protein